MTRGVILRRCAATGLWIGALSCGGGGDTTGPQQTVVTVAVVTVSPASAAVELGGTTQLTATLTDARGAPVAGRAVTWTSGTVAVASVSSDGLVTGVSIGGPVAITATSDGRSGAAQVTVTQAVVAAVAVAPASASVAQGSTVQLTATPRDARGNPLSGRTVTWSSANTALATVSSSGVVTGVTAGGPVAITATSEGQNGSAQVTVTQPPVASVSVSPANTALGVGATAQLSVTLRDASNNVLSNRAVTWASSNAAIATVSATGLVTGVALGGPVTITATSEGRSGSATVNVLAPVATVTISPGSTFIGVGGAAQLSVTLRDAAGNILSARPVSWTTSDVRIATIGTSSGLVIGVGGGTATITANVEGKQGFSQVQVGVPSIYDGTWSGTAGGGRSAQFIVLLGRITDVTLSLGTTGSVPPPPCPITLTGTPNAVINGTFVVFGMGAGSGFNTNVTLSFGTATAASLQYSQISFSGFRGCPGFIINGSFQGGQLTVAKQ